MCEEDNPAHSGSDVTNVTIPIQQGERNTFFIPSISNPNPFDNGTFVWDKELAKVQGVSIHGDRLKITTVLASGERKYHVSFSGFRAYFGLTVTEVTHKTPEAILNPQSVEKSLGDTLVMMCVFQGCPTPNVMWFHNGEPVQADGVAIKISQFSQSTFTTSELIIPVMREEDTGSYVCQGENGEDRVVDSMVGTVTLVSSTKLAKRSTEENPLCRSKTPSDTGELCE